MRRQATISLLPVQLYSKTPLRNVSNQILSITLRWHRSPIN